MKAQVWLYRRTSGKMGSMKGTVVLLTTTGRRSGEVRTVPLHGLREDDHYLVAASAGGGPKNPGWYYNLKGDAPVTLQDRDRVIKVNATIPEGDDRDELWGKFVAADERFAKYTEKTERVIPVVVLRPV
jgi:deazaflavin-dependent oxidoreductase (nitroreductase family)